MLIVRKRRFFAGFALAILFFIVLAIAFSPRFDGRNAFQAADSLFNSIAKGSSDYIDDLRGGVVRDYKSIACDVTVTLRDADVAARARTLLSRAGVRSDGSGTTVSVKGAIGAVMATSLDDAELMFRNRGDEVARVHGYGGRDVLFTWWSLLKGMQRALQDQARFEDAAAVEEVIARGIEVAYNFYGIEAWRASTHAGVLTSVLIFYVVYTLWWGFAIMYLFDGMGLVMKAGAKREV